MGQDRNPLAQLRQGDHLCMICDGFRHREAALLSFLAGGFSADERCLVFAAQPSRRRIETALARSGVEVFAAMDRGRLVFVSPRDLPTDAAGAPLGDAGTLIDLIRQAEQEALEDGYSGLRLTWEVRKMTAEGTPAGGSRRPVEDLVELEARLNRFLSGSRTIVLCQYSRALCGPELLYQALRTHPRAMLAQQLCPNHFYEPPEVVLGKGVSGEIVDWMLARLRRAWQREASLEQMDRQLAEEREALERAGEAREQLLAMLAHELRNPLATVSNALQVLRLGEGKHSADDAWRRAIEAAERQVFHQSLLVDDLIEASLEVVDGYRETMRTALPLEGEAAGDPPASGVTVAQGARRILVVEDNLDAAITLRDFLELSGFQVKIASSGTAGVEAARQFSPEVVLCDLGLPGMNGFEVAARLRRDPATSSVRLIAITGYGGEEDRRRSREAGFDLHLTKPVDPTQLRRVLQETTRAA